MKVYHGLETVQPAPAGSIVTIGNFDGVHRAHQRLVAEARKWAAEGGEPVVVLTFEPHPLTIVAPHRAPARLTPLAEKLRALELVGADLVVVAGSTPELLALEPEQFVRDIVWERLHPTHIIEGSSFRFGKGRRGTPELLERVAAEFGCQVHMVDPVLVDLDGEQAMLSSSLVRRLLGEGKVEQTTACLGRPYALLGTVIEGVRRGRGIGFPTANLEVMEQLIPADGVYAGHTTVGDSRWACAVSIGHTPTFQGTLRRVEAHLLDFEGDLYGQPLRIEFDRFLRQQRTFPSTEALARQLQADVEAVRESKSR